MLLFIILFRLVIAAGQTPVGTWSDHLSYNTAASVAAGPGFIFASTGSSIMVYDKSAQEVRKLTPINGLSESGISCIGWSAEYATLVIAYTSSNVDLFSNNSIYNLPDILRKFIPGRKAINRIRNSGRYSYLACSFGIVVLDLQKKEVYDTWKPGVNDNTEVWDVALLNGKIYAATNEGIYWANLSDQGLSYNGNWHLLTILPVPTGKYTGLVSSGGKLYANYSDPGGDIIYVIDSTCSLFNFEAGDFNYSLEASSNGFTVSSGKYARFFNSSGVLQKTILSYGWGTPDIVQAVADNEDMWIADFGTGLIYARNMTEFSLVTLPGPSSNNAYSMTCKEGKTVICAGGATVSWNSQQRPMQVSVHDNNGWTCLSIDNMKDPMRALIDPDDHDHIFISTWGGGLLEYDNGTLVNRFDDSNSPLQTIIAGAAFVRICGLAMDDHRNLWITQTEVQGSIKVLKPDHSWIVNPITIDAPTIGDIMIASNGYKWIVLPRGYGIFILDDNGTPENFTDDRSLKTLIRDDENNVATQVYSIAEDLEGNVWVGTDMGPFVYYNAGRILDEELHATRIRVPRNDGTNLADYLLGTETITGIGVDGANRKWFATSGSGVYLVSEDGITRILQFNEENSPLLSNNVVSLTLDNKTGDVWFGTSKGIQSWRGNATSGGERFSGIYSFPNPVREDYTGNVTITGLVRNTEIKITDVSGNLVYQTMSDGGMATWDLKNYTGQRVATGVYLVFCASPGGTEAKVTKILVIK